MSIDELSAAIDAHMDNVESVSVKPNKPQPTMDEKVEAAIKKVAKTEVSTPEPSNKSSKIKVRKNSYISKAKEETNKSDAPSKEPDGRISAGKRDIKPATDTTASVSKSSRQTKSLSPAESAELAKGKIVDVVVKTTETSPQKKTPATPKPSMVSSDPAKTEPAVEKKIVTPPVSAKEETPKVETKTTAPAPSTKSEPKVETKPANPPKKNAPVDNLASQIVEKKSSEKMPAKSDTLKTFDTKEYHIPIKPSRHHRAGSSFMVFAAVFAAILAVVYVLNELEIIDLVELLYPS